ncbi:flagellar hook-basal body protein [Paraburkholderia metrosideri]|jgi:flagellar basal-body rod protein FlgF|uniref:Flagellar basal-body rod protein FlgG n=1 Tax=Paraburkholderia metrosideri TaxID=580937 RepID=A0ABN7I5S4_9BURK|nr:flagellar hook-basal body protein [Paraburkholderia metrosideri]CAD6549016.1 Flagellar basal-body rod protein FlgG [Paraburkholderia metrosideri]
MDNLMTLATGLISQETRRVETAGQNLANVATPGYKRQIAFDDVLAESRAQSAPPSPVTPSRTTGIATDFSAGKLVHTGNPLDLSISGPGLFEVITANGPAYTRAGSFQRDADGRIVTAQGWPLQSAGGGDVVVRSNNWQIASDGTVLDDGTPSSVIRVATFVDPAQLVRGADSLFHAKEAQAVDSEQAHIVQGFIETSNVAVGNDMMQMMEAMRRIESGQKLVHAYDDMVGTVLQRLGDM